MGGMTCDEMLSRISSHELSEWEAYERAHGPLGDAYAHYKLAELHELLQAILLSLSSDGEGRVQRVQRPNEVFEALREAQAQAQLSDEERDERKRDDVAAFAKALQGHR